MSLFDGVGRRFGAAIRKVGTTLRFAFDLLPMVTDTYDLGSTALKWEDLHLNGSIVCGGISPTGDITLATTKKLILGDPSRYITDDGTNAIFKTTGGSIIVDGKTGISLRVDGTPVINIASSEINTTSVPIINVTSIQAPSGANLSVKDRFGGTVFAISTNTQLITSGKTLAFGSSNRSMQDDGTNLTITNTSVSGNLDIRTTGINSKINIDGETGATLSHNGNVIAEILATYLAINDGYGLRVYRTGGSNYAGLSKGATDNLTITEGVGSIIVNGKTGLSFQHNSTTYLTVSSASVDVRVGHDFRVYNAGNSAFGCIKQNSTVMEFSNTGGELDFTPGATSNMVIDCEPEYGLDMEGNNGCGLLLLHKTETITVATTATEGNSSNALVPAGAIVMGVISRVTQGSTNPSTVDIGFQGDGNPDRIIADMGAALNQTAAMSTHNDGTDTSAGIQVASNTELTVTLDVPATVTDHITRVTVFYFLPRIHSS